MSRDEQLYKLQHLLYVWMSQYEDRSIETIKSSCDSLCENYDLQYDNPVWEIFWPLVFNGLIDHVGAGRYALTEPLILDYGDHYFCINFEPGIKHLSPAIGIYLTGQMPTEQDVKVVKEDALRVLKHFPSIDTVVNEFSKTLQDESNLEFYNWKIHQGIAKMEKDGLTRYFSLPKKLYIRELPNRNVNPEAFAIAYCLSRSVNHESNGRYNMKAKMLFMPTFAMPFSLYRVLMLETMVNKELPEKLGTEYRFKNIPERIVKELNRILCNSISYE